LSWNYVSEELSLRSDENSSQLLTPNPIVGIKQTSSNESDSPDVESQSTDSKNEKAKRKGFRVDARVISDATIGLSDGLTVPFALTAGLSALGNTKVVIFGGFAELIAGAISMGLGGYLGAKSEAWVNCCFRLGPC
jgi:vacuolar iron transporter family protein